MSILPSTVIILFHLLNSFADFLSADRDAKFVNERFFKNHFYFQGNIRQRWKHIVMAVAVWSLAQMLILLRDVHVFTEVA